MGYNNEIPKNKRRDRIGYINILVKRANIENIQLNKGVNHDYRNII